MPLSVLDQKISERFALYHGDCVEVVRGLPSESIHYSCFSPPFASLYVYGPSDRDFGNSRDHDEFYRHFALLIPELLRVTKPGRLLSFHCMDLPTSKTRDGVIGLTDFPGLLIRAFQEAGWIYHAKATIRKDPVTAMQRTKAIGLLHKQVKKDSCLSRMGIPDYFITMRKPGANPEPVSHSDDLDMLKNGKILRAFPVRDWQQIAEPIWEDVYACSRTGSREEDLAFWERQYASDWWKSVQRQWAENAWMDINPSDTLQYRSAREHADERHVCPIQLEVVRRGLRLYTNPEDVVLSPFGGIGSEPWTAIREGRRAVAIELKGSYYRQMVANLATATSEARTLFDLAAPP